MPGMDFEAYSERLATLHEYCFESKPKKIERKRFQIINDSVQMKSVKKTQFSGLNDKGFYFHNGIVSLPFRYFLLNKVRQAKEKHQADLHTKIQKEMSGFLALESRAVHLCASFGADKKFKINKRTNNKWKLKISQFTTDSSAVKY